MLKTRLCQRKLVISSESFWFNAYFQIFTQRAWWADTAATGGGSVELRKALEPLTFQRSLVFNCVGWHTIATVETLHCCTAETLHCCKDFYRWVQWITDSCFVINFWKFKIKIYVRLRVDAIIVSIWVLKRVPRSQLLRLFNDGSDDTALLSWFLLKIRSVRIRHWFGCSLRPGTPLNSPCQKVGFICPFVVIDPTNLGATTKIARNLLQDLKGRIPAFLPFG